MGQKLLRCVIVDDDAFMLNVIKDLCNDSSSVIVADSFLSPTAFIRSVPRLDFDFCILDICMPEMDGIEVAKKLPGVPIVFITSVYDKLRDALDTSPVDVVPKPIRKERFANALEKVQKHYANINIKNKEYDLFYIAETKGRMKLKLSDILYARTDSIDCRNKQVIMKNGSNYTLMNCTLEKLLQLSPSLIRVNKTEVISLEIFQKLEYDVITLINVPGKMNLSQITLSRTYKRNFLAKVSS